MKNMILKIVPLLMRLAILSLWIKLISDNPIPETPPFCTWIALIIIALYLWMISIFWAEKMSCPFFACKKWTCSSQK